VPGGPPTASLLRGHLIATIDRPTLGEQPGQHLVVALGLGLGLRVQVGGGIQLAGASHPRSALERGDEVAAGHELVEMEPDRGDVQPEVCREVGGAAPGRRSWGGLAGHDVEVFEDSSAHVGGQDRDLLGAHEAWSP
jgi:hypothetical protein